MAGNIMHTCMDATKFVGVGVCVCVCVHACMCVVEGHKSHNINFTFHKGTKYKSVYT